MSKGNPQAGGSTSGFGSQGQFGTGYTQPYGAPGTGTYDPMLGFGQASGMGTTFNYPTRYSADYTRYAQSGQPFNQPVMGYNTYGQIFAQPQRPQPPPIMGGGKGGGGFQPGYGYQPPQQLPTMGGKGGPQPRNDRVTISYPGGSRTFPRSPERRSNQLGLNQPPASETNIGNFLDFYKRQNNPANSIFEPGSQPPTIGDKGGGGQTDNITIRRPSVGFDPEGRSRNRQNNLFGLTQPAVMPEYAYPTNQLPQVAYEYNQAPTLVDGLPVGPVAANRPVIDENIYNSPFAGLIGNGLGGMPIGRPQTDPNLRVMGERNFDMQGFDMPSQPFNFGQDFGRMYFQEGGQVPPDANMEMMLSEAGPANPQSEMAGEYDRLIQMTMQAVLGQTENADEIIQMFIDEFGVDAFRQLRDAVLKQQVPNAQTEGMVDGNGGGMDDQVMGMIGNQRPVAVSPGEYIVPADVVSGLGDGSSKSGADILDELNQAVRMARTGTPEQPRPLMETLQQ